MSGLKLEGEEEEIRRIEEDETSSSPATTRRNFSMENLPKCLELLVKPLKSTEL